MDQATYDRLVAKARRTIDLFTFDEFISFWGADRPDALALDGDDLSLTYGALEDATARVASALLAMGLSPGDRIAWFGKNATTYFTLFFGAARAGIVMVPVGWRLAEPEAAFIIDNAAFHKNPKIRALLEAHGHKLVFLPRYSPHLNPIENIWADLKAFIRRSNLNLFDALSTKLGN